MKSSEYWKGRFDQIEQASNNKSVKFTKQLDKKYKTAANEIDTKINAWYQRLADNNGVSITEAKKLLTNSELKEFKWTVQEYIKAGEENALDQRWMKELENASAKFHISRLEALKLECKQQVEMAMGTGQYDMFDTLANVYKDTYYHSCFEVQKGVGVGFDVSKLSDKQVQTVLNKPWSVDGTNFSTKVWNNKTKLINNLDQELSRMVMTGESPRQAIQNIRKSMDTSLYNAKRLVMTESAYFTTVGQQDAFEELDVEEYEIVATLDNRTSDICQKQDGQHYPVKDMMPGVNAPPFHVFCRSTTCPYFNDEFTVDDKRVAKNEETGEWYEVPANMTYPEWKNSFVDGGSKDELTPIDDEPEEFDDIKEWTPKKTSSMVRDPANFRKQVEPDNIPVVVEDDDMDMFEDIVAFHPATSKAEAVEFAKTLTVNGEFEVDGIHLNTVNGFNEAMFNVEQRFGKKLNIAGVKVVKTADAKYHQGSYDPMTKFVSLKGGNSANALTTYKANAEKFFKDGWNASDDVYGTFYHEIGHSVWDDLPTTAKNEIRDIYKKTRHSAYEKWMAMGGSHSGYSQAEVFGKELSRYALENEQEFFSEAFSQIMSGRARPVSREVRDILDKYYKVADDVVEDVVEDVIKESIQEIVEYKEPVTADYNRMLKGSQKAISADDALQVAAHEKADGSQGGYVATNNYITINSNMRNDSFTRNTLDEDDLKTIESMRNAIASYELDDNMVMTRYVNADYLTSVFGIRTKMWSKGDLEEIVDSITRIGNPYVVKTAIPTITEELQKFIGESIPEKAFISASVIPKKNVMKDKSVCFKIRAKKGTHCYLPVNKKESEIIFADNSKLIIQDVEWDDTLRKWIITTDIE